MRRVVLIGVLLAALLEAQLQISQRASPVNDYQTALAVTAGNSRTVASSVASNTRLMGVDIWSSVGYKALVYTVTNSVQSTNPVAVGGAPPFTSFQWRSPDPAFVSLGSSGGTDTYAVVVTNLDPNSPADFFVSFHYSL